MVEIDDHSIIKRILLGNIDAFALLIDRYQQTVYHLTFNMTGNEEDARDLTQEIFIKAYLNLRKVDPQYKFFSWLYRIAVNETLNYSKRKIFLLPLEELPVINGHLEDEEVTQKERRQFVRRAILQLKPKYRLLIVLKYYSGLSYDQISVVTGVPENKIKSRLFEARQILGKLLKK